MTPGSLLELTADIVAAHVGNNTVSASELPTIIARVHAALVAVTETASAGQDDTPQIPKVSPRASIKPDHLVCMECGAKQVMLRRHLRTAHSITPAEYRSRFGLHHDYPMSCPNYSAKRRDLANATGLGRKPKQVERKRLSISNGRSKAK